MSAELSSEDLLSLSDLAQRDDWGRGRNALSFLSRTISTDFARAVSNEFPWFANPPCWKSGLNAMERVFGFGLSHHLFHADPLDWLQMTETQATAGLAWFLNAEDRTVRNGRIRTMLRALDRNGSRFGRRHLRCECDKRGPHQEEEENRSASDMAKRFGRTVAALSSRQSSTTGSREGN